MKTKLIISAMIASALTILIGLVGAFIFDKYLTAIPYLYFGTLCLTVSILYNLLRFVVRCVQMIAFLAITILFMTFLIGWFYTPLLKDNGVYYIFALITLIWWLFIEVYVEDKSFWTKYVLISLGLISLLFGVILSVEWLFYITYGCMAVELSWMLYRVNRTIL